MERSRLVWVVSGAAVVVAAAASGLVPWRVGQRPTAQQPALSAPAPKRQLQYARRASPEELAAKAGGPVLAFKQTVLLNANAHIPPQCFTKTQDDQGKVHNPCYTCHVSSRPPNYIDDGDLQREYSLAWHARKNPWTNLFTDWRPAIAKISDDEITSYIRTSNYFDADGNIALARTLASVPRDWDVDEDGKWAGYVADARFRFDTEGFDRTQGGGYTGWRAYAYYPVPGTFWPTNGSMGDALIRLPDAFRRDASGALDLGVYKVNLAVVEALVARRDVAIDPVDETRYGVDLDRDGVLATASMVDYAEDEGEPRPMSYVGRARLELEQGRTKLHPGLFPEGTELLHTVRYLDPTDGGIQLSARLKELRYARKIGWYDPKWLEQRAGKEAQEKADAPFERRALGGDLEHGVDNGQGWRYQGFIEDARGALRPQSFEETAYCAGCHGGVGSTSDGTFSFARKLGGDAFQRGWYHWSQRGLQGVSDPRLPDGRTEYVAYLERNGAADEFRQNEEVARRFFRPDGSLKPDMRARLTRDVTSVLLPTRARALALDKAYRELVKQQSFRFGREIVLDGARNVHRDVPPSLATGIETPELAPWMTAATSASR